MIYAHFGYNGIDKDTNPEIQPKSEFRMAPNVQTGIKVQLTITASCEVSEGKIGDLAALIISTLQQNTILENIKVTVR